MIFTKKQRNNIKRLADAVRDSNVLAKLAYEFGQMGNYFDRANSAHSRKLLAKEDSVKYKEFVRKAIQVKAQLQKELAGMRTAIIPSNYAKMWDASTQDLLNDGTNRLYWVASDMRDAVGEKLSKEIRELVTEYSKIISLGSDKWRKQQRRDSKAKDANVDVAHIADYLWTWRQRSAGGWDACTIIEDYITPETLTESNLKKGIAAAEKELDNIYSQLKITVEKYLKDGYNRQKQMIQKEADMFRSHKKYQG